MRVTDKYQVHSFFFSVPDLICCCLYVVVVDGDVVVLLCVLLLLFPSGYLLSSCCCCSCSVAIAVVEYLHDEAASHAVRIVLAIIDA